MKVKSGEGKKEQQQRKLHQRDHDENFIIEIGHFQQVARLQPSNYYQFCQKKSSRAKEIEETRHDPHFDRCFYDEVPNYNYCDELKVKDRFGKRCGEICKRFLSASVKIDATQNHCRTSVGRLDMFIMNA